MLILIKADLNNTPSIIPMCPTRWTVKWAALNAIIANYVFLLLTFEQSFREESKTDMKYRIQGVRFQMLQFETYFALSLAKIILLQTDNLATALQQQKISATEGKELYKVTAKTLLKIRNETYDQFWEQTLKESKELGIEDPKLKKKRKITKKK